MDTFHEQLVTKPNDNQTNVKKIGVFVLAVFIAVLLFYFLNLYSIPFVALLFWGAYILIGNFDIEYEYICTNGDLDIDKIIAKKKRKRLITVDIRSASDFGKISDFNNKNNYSIINASSGDIKSSFFITVKDAKRGVCNIYFSPDEEMLSVITNYLSPQIKVALRRS